jgi:hypothetical protein
MCGSGPKPFVIAISPIPDGFVCGGTFDHAGGSSDGVLCKLYHHPFVASQCSSNPNEGLRHIRVIAYPFVAVRAEPAAFAGKGQQILVPAIGTAHAGEAALQVAAVEVLAHDLRNDRAQVAEFRFEFQGIDGQEIVEISGDAPPERRGPRLPGTVGLYNRAPQCRKEGVSSNGTPPRQVGET